MKISNIFCQSLNSWFCSSNVLSEKCFVVFYVFSFPAGVYFGTLNLCASIPDPSVLALHMIIHLRIVGIIQEHELSN